jgi:uncharacterized protein (TIGR02145 family)
LYKFLSLDSKINVLFQSIKIKIMKSEKMIKWFVLSFIVMLIVTDCKKDDKVEVQYSSVTDIEGNTYKTGKIADQWWFFEDLNVSKFSDGTEIPNGTGLLPEQSIMYETNPNYYFNHQNGKFYTYHVVVDSCKICPQGWHVPSDNEWSELVDAVGGFDNAGSKLKELKFVTNYNGMYGYMGQNDGINSYCNWWSTSGEGRSLFANKTNLPIGGGPFYYGLSIRCVKDK